MEADINTLYRSDFYRILNFKCRCQDCLTSKPEYNDSFCISFVRKGNFIFNVFRRSLDSFTGTVLITKPEGERTVTHGHAVPDECTILELNREFYTSVKEQFPLVRFLRDPDLHSTLIRSHAGLETCHLLMWKLLQKGRVSQLKMDSLATEIIRLTLESISDTPSFPSIHPKLKKNHLTTMEKAREYLAAHSTEDISLLQLARHCHLSPFHFNRIFKAFTFCTPHQYLMSLRLKQAELFLREKRVPVADIAFTSGFNSIEHFSAAFRKRYGLSPARFREQEAGFRP